MKHLVIFLILLNINHSFAQKLRITGQIFEIKRLVIYSKPDLSNPFDRGIPRDSFYIGSSYKFNIYLTDKPEENSTKKELLNNTMTPYFDIKINLKKTRIFNIWNLETGYMWPMQKLTH